MAHIYSISDISKSDQIRLLTVVIVRIFRITFSAAKLHASVNKY